MTEREAPPAEGEFLKLPIRLTDEQIGPFPIAVESLWCAREGIYYRVKNVPFFIDGLSFDDLISVSKVDNDLFLIDSIVTASKNSTICVLLKDDVQGRKLIESLGKLGCGIEGGVFPDCFAINVPSTTDLDFVLRILGDGESVGQICCDYPSIRR